MLVLAACLPLGVPGCMGPPDPTPLHLARFEFAGEQLGVEVRIVVYAEERAQAQDAARHAFLRIDQVERVAGDYSSISELRVLSGLAGGPWVPAGDDLFTMLDKALELAADSDGAFDPTVGPYLALWRESRRSRRLPPQARLEAVRDQVGWQLVELDSRRQLVRLRAASMRLDLGGLVRGFAADRALEVLADRGVSCAMVDVGGDVVVGAEPPGRTGWRIPIPQPGPGEPGEIEISYAAVSTSGDRDEFVVIDGVRYAGTVDPRTGLGLTDRVLATVVAEDGATADGLATAARILGPERGRALLAARGVQGWVRRTE